MHVCVYSQRDNTIILRHKAKHIIRLLKSVVTWWVKLMEKQVEKVNKFILFLGSEWMNGRVNEVCQISIVYN